VSGGSFITKFIKGSQGTWGLGTLGFFASINNVPQYNNIVLVSNMHVLADHGAAKGDNVRIPEDGDQRFRGIVIAIPG